MLAAHDMFPRTARLNCNSGLYPVSCIVLIGIRNSNRRGGAFFRSRSQVSTIYHLAGMLIVRGLSGIWPGTRRLSPVAWRLSPVACWKRQMGVCIPFVRAGLVAPYLAQWHGPTGYDAQRASALEKNGGQIERRATSSGDGSDWI